MRCLFRHQSKNIFPKSVLLPILRYYCGFSVIRSNTVVRGGSRTPATSTNGDIGCNSYWLQVEGSYYKKVLSCYLGLRPTSQYS